MPGMSATVQNGVVNGSSDGPLPSSSTARTGKENGIRDVWASNLEEEFKLVRAVVQQYPYVAMDTEFPGVVARPLGEFRSQQDYQYQLLRVNVDMLKLIQVGLTFMNEKGELPPEYSTWQFNFKFCLDMDMFAQDSVELLLKSGIQFRRLEEDGIDVFDFAELLMTSGLVLFDNVTWLSFHSGYDFGYLMKIVTNKQLPEDEEEFFDLLKLFYPNIYDIKTLMRCSNLRGGLQEISDQLQVDRIGPQHQAGSDSLLTGNTFFKIKEKYFNDDWSDVGRYAGMLYGLGSVTFQPNGPSFLNNGSAVPFDQVQAVPGRGGLIEGRNAINVPISLVEAQAAGRGNGNSERESSTSSSATQGTIHKLRDSCSQVNGYVRG